MPPKRPTPLSDELFAPPVLLGSTHLGAPVSLKNNFADMAVLTPTPLGIQTPQLCAIPATPSPSHNCYMREGISRGGYLQQATAAQMHERLYGAKQQQPPAGAPQMGSRAAPQHMQVSMGPVEMGWPSQHEVFSYPQQCTNFLPFEPVPAMQQAKAQVMQPLAAARPGRDATRLVAPQPPPPPPQHADRDEESDEDDDDDSQIAVPIHSGTVAKPPPGALHPSVGSEGHAAGTCKRCCFFPRGRCANGWGCEFCHYEHEKRKRKNKAKKKTPISKAPTSSSASRSDRPPLHQRPTLSSAIQAASQHQQGMMGASSVSAQVSQPTMGQCTYLMQTHGACASQQMAGAGMQYYQPYAQPMMMYGTEALAGGSLSTVPSGAGCVQQQSMSMQPAYHVMRLPPAVSHQGGIQDHAFLLQHQQQQQQQQMAPMMPQQQQQRSTSYFTEVAPPPPPLRSPRLNRVFGQEVGRQQRSGGSTPPSLAPTLLLGMHSLGSY